MVKLLVTTGCTSTWGEVARIILLMLLLSEEGGGAFCSSVGGLLVRVVLLGNGLAPMLLFMDVQSGRVSHFFFRFFYFIFFFRFFFFSLRCFCLLHTEFLVL